MILKRIETHLCVQCETLNKPSTKHSAIPALYRVNTSASHIRRKRSKSWRTFEVIGKFHRPLMQGVNVVSERKTAELLSVRACVFTFWVFVAAAMVERLINSPHLHVCRLASLALIPALRFVSSSQVEARKTTGYVVRQITHRDTRSNSVRSRNRGKQRRLRVQSDFSHTLSARMLMR